ncbi:MAG: metallo-beta-lactamase family protein [Candidatus Parcubacteria bacterium]|jgi:metallo-beta-lactamase family protein|nr:metallo-beta-lactamase family protein [Candidatus Parcubacteria bacterium]
MALTLTFHGGAESVTGSNFLVEGDRGRLLVDCGVEQGKDFCQECMYDRFPYDASAIDALIITHSHLDHIGRAPKLVREGFKGTVYATAPTRDLMVLILLDSARILSQEARRRKQPPLYDENDVEALMSRVKVIEYGEEWEAAPGLSCVLRQTGHILGSASVRIKDEDGTSLALTGDIGNAPSPFLPDPVPVDDADVLVMESVYGDRQNPQEGRVERLRDTLKEAIARGGAILIPAFSIERTQLMLYEISNFMEAGEIPKVPVFLDSPLAIKVTDVYAKWGEKYFKPEVEDELHREHDIFRFPFLTQTPSREESEAIGEARGAKIIIAGAGMSHGGRIARWEEKYLPHADTTLMIVGYQAPGSPGRLLQDGARSIRVNGRTIPVRGKVATFTGWSAHADRDGLIAFAEKSLPRVKTIFTALGEPSSARFLAQRIHDYLGVKAIVPSEGQKWEITKEGATQITK